MTVLLAVNLFTNYPSVDDGKPLSIVWIIIRTIPNLFMRIEYEAFLFIIFKKIQTVLVTL